MKKVIIMIISFILFTCNADALTVINNMEINVDIDQAGNAHVIEVWHYPKQNNEIIVKNFYGSLNSEIKDLVITDSANHTYESTDSIKREKYKYNYSDKGSNKYLKINTDETEKTIKLEYNLTGIIKSYKDTLGINWYFLNTSNDLNVKTLNITIKNYTELNKNNTGIYLTANNGESEFNSGKLVITAKDLNNRNKVLLLTTFTNIDYENKVPINSDFNEYYERNKPSLINDIKNFLASETLVILIIIIIIISVAAIVDKFVLNNGRSPFDCIKVKNKDNLIRSTTKAEYNEVIPCDGDLYHIEFISSLLNITKNRSNIISAIILKWILAGYAGVDIDENIITVEENLVFNNELDQELYEILKTATSSLKIKENKLDIYFKDHEKELNEWFYHIYSYGIKKEYELGNIKIRKRKIITNNEIIKKGNQIVGLKKYLLNFNQVPRKSKLTSDMYKDLLVLSSLLGISESLSKEILRKNKDNKLAIELENFGLIKELLIPAYSIRTNKNLFSTFNPIVMNKKRRK